MKKYILTTIAILVLIVGVIWLSKILNNKNKDAKIENSTSNYQAERSSINQSTENSINNTNLSNSISTENQQKKEPKETEIAQFSTKIYNRDSKRQNNITITCKALSAKEVAAGTTFSFCDAVGKATSSKGYQKADIYVNGEKKQGLGGGNCQVSTTLYNAVLKVSDFEIVERHQHSGKVPYIQSGKDAAVSYGTYDFKFKNNTGNSVKIVMENTPDNITAKIIKIG